MGAIEQYRETALDSPYSRDREEAIETLADLYSDADEVDQRRIAETLRDVAVESAHRDERELARDTLIECFESAPDSIAGIVVETFTDLARGSKFSEERFDAIDTLRRVYPDLDEHQRDEVGQTLAEIAGNATSAEERRRARTKLSDVSRIERESDGEDDGGEAVDYLGQSLAEHLEAAAHEGREACLQRAEEIAEFMVDQSVDDEAYADVREDVEGLIEALAVMNGEELADDRIERVDRIASRVERLYARE